MQELLFNLKNDFPSLLFESGATFYWSPKHQKIIYKSAPDNQKIALWSLLHETGHALLSHSNYDSDFQLLQLEVEAWQKALELAQKYGLEIDEDHIQDCLDTYREWLYQRSTCPTCTNTSLQKDGRTYECFNCGTVWFVSQSRMCRPYRRKQKETLV